MHAARAVLEPVLHFLDRVQGLLAHLQRQPRLGTRRHAGVQRGGEEAERVRRGGVEETPGFLLALGALRGGHGFVRDAAGGDLLPHRARRPLHGEEVLVALQEALGAVSQASYSPASPPPAPARRLRRPGSCWPAPPAPWP